MRIYQPNTVQTKFYQILWPQYDHTDLNLSTFYGVIALYSNSIINYSNAFYYIVMSRGGGVPPPPGHPLFICEKSRSHSRPTILIHVV